MAGNVSSSIPWIVLLPILNIRPSRPRVPPGGNIGCTNHSLRSCGFMLMLGDRLCGRDLFVTPTFHPVAFSSARNFTLVCGQLGNDMTRPEYRHLNTVQYEI